MAVAPKTIMPGDWPIDPNVVDGTELAARLNRLQAVIASGNVGTTRPTYLQAGAVWAQQGSTPGDYILNFFDGTTDHPIGTIIGGVTKFGGATFNSGATATKPASPAKGDIFFDTTLNRAEFYDGGAWKFTDTYRPNTNVFKKADSRSPAFTKTGASSLSIKAGTVVELDGKFIEFKTEKVISMPALAAGTDYFIWVNQDGSVQAVADSGASPAAGARKIGGFHYSPGGHSGNPGGGNSTPEINQYSLWDLKFKPEAQDPRGMVLVANSFWSDIYLCGVDHIANGTSKYNVLIADGASPPKIPTAFGGNGSNAFSSMNWWEASEVVKSHGKRLPSYGEFGALAYGTTEQTSRGTDPGNTIWEPAYVSKFGVCQATGNLWSWGSDFSFRPDGGGDGWAWRTGHTNGRGDLHLYNVNGLVAAIFGGNWSDAADSGSRASLWNDYPWLSYSTIGARGVCDHLILE